jgi:hypothetical protein
MTLDNLTTRMRAIHIGIIHGTRRVIRTRLVVWSRSNIDWSLEIDHRAWSIVARIIDGRVASCETKRKN